MGIHPAELVEARNMALAKQGLFASCTPTIAWNYHFGDMEAFYAERFAQVDAQDAFVEPEDTSTRRPNVLQQWRLQKPGRTLVRERDDGVSKREIR
jgi:hypothetical protein